MDLKNAEKYSENDPLILKSTGIFLSGYKLTNLSPILSNGYTLLGETDKYVSVSVTRFESIFENEKEVKL